MKKPDATKAVLEVSGLSVHRDGVAILKEVSWSVRPGEHWVILGANGSGKTSLLSALTGYLMPTSGEVELLGKRFGRDDWRDLRMRVGLVSSSIRQMMHDAEPALETVASGRWAMIDLWRKLGRNEIRMAKSLLSRMECSHLEERPWGVLSQGERQRVLIGRALMARPRLLILDEPCAGLDPAAREQFLSFLQRLAEDPGCVPMLFVTHHVEEIVPAFTHLLMLRNGAVCESGPLKRVMNSANLRRTFGVPVRLNRDRGRYRMSIGISKAGGEAGVIA